ncbi:uncharacterized protein LOC144707869 isoform X4 [Wolffia australiana]
MPPSGSLQLPSPARSTNFRAPELELKKIKICIIVRTEHALNLGDRTEAHQKSRRDYGSSVKDIFPKYNDHSMKVEKHFDVKRLESENANDRNVTSNIRDKALEELTSSELGRIQGLLQSVRRERKLKEHITKLQAETKSLMEENKKLKEEMAEMLTGGSGGQPDAEPNSPEDDGSFDVTLRLGYL